MFGPLLQVSLACGGAFQCLSGRLGLVTGKDLAQHCGERWPRGARWLLWAMLEGAIVAVDIQETVGCAQALYMLSSAAVPLWAGCIVVSASAFVLLLLERRGARWLEALFGSIIAGGCGWVGADEACRGWWGWGLLLSAGQS